MQSKIAKVSLTGRTWISKQDNSTMYVHQYVMEDNVIFQANHKSELPFLEGDLIDYNITKDDEQYGKTASVKKPEQASQSNYTPKGNDDARQLMIVRQSSLNRAVEILIHNAVATGVEPRIDELDVTELAERLTKWVMQPSNN